MLIYIVIGIIVLAAIVGIVIITIYNKFQFAIIKIEEAENNIDPLLQKKENLLKRLISLIEEKDQKNEKILEKFITKQETAKSNFEIHKELAKAMHELQLLLDEDASLREVEAITEIETDLFDIDLEIEAAVKYYNDNVTIYNKLIRCFPSNGIRHLFSYQKKEFYSNEKEEIYEILKTK